MIGTSRRRTLDSGTLPRRFPLGIVLAGRCDDPTTDSHFCMRATSSVTNVLLSF